ncbi:serine-rich adhesin for platelets isoform X2 [Drosophila bipectinata]
MCYFEKAILLLNIMHATIYAGYPQGYSQKRIQYPSRRDHAIRFNKNNYNSDENFYPGNEGQNIYQADTDRDQNVFNEYDSLSTENLPNSLEEEKHNRRHQRHRNFDQSLYQDEPQKLENVEEQGFQENQSESMEDVHNYKPITRRDQYHHKEQELTNSDEDIAAKQQNHRFNNRDQYYPDWNEYIIPRERHQRNFYKNRRKNELNKRQKIYFSQNRNQHQPNNHRYSSVHEIPKRNRISNNRISEPRRNHRIRHQWKNIHQNLRLKKYLEKISAQPSQEQLNVENRIPKVKSLENINKTQKSAKVHKDLIDKIREAQKYILKIQRTLQTGTKYKSLENESQTSQDPVLQISPSKGRWIFRSGKKAQEGHLGVREKATNLIQKWAESQRLMVDSFAKAITEILKSHDVNPSPGNNVPQEKLVVMEDLLKQVVDSIKKLREDTSHKSENNSNGSPSKETKEHVNAVLQKWIETQKTLIDSFLDAVRKLTGLKPEERKPALESNASEIEIMENLIKRLRELIEHLNGQKVASSSTTTSTTSEIPATHTPYLTTESSSTSTETTSSTTISSATALKTDKPLDTTTESSSTSVPTTSSTTITLSTSTLTDKPPVTTTESSSTTTTISLDTKILTSTTTSSSASISTTSSPSPDTTSSPTTSSTSTAPTSTQTESDSTKMTESSTPTNPSTTSIQPLSTTSHSTTETPNPNESSISKLKKILDLLKKLRKILNTIVEKSNGKISSDLIERVRSMLNQIVTNHVDLTKNDSAELEELLSTTMKPNTSKGPDLTKEKLIELVDNFEKLYQQLLGEQLPSTTESTTKSTTTSSTSLETSSSTATIETSSTIKESPTTIITETPSTTTEIPTTTTTVTPLTTTTTTETPTTTTETPLTTPETSATTTGTSTTTTSLSTETTTTRINSTTENPTTTSKSVDSTQSTINPSGAPSGNNTTNINNIVTENLNLKPIVDAIQQLKMAIYHDFDSFKKDQVDRMEKIMKLMQDLKEVKSLNKRTKTIAKPRTQLRNSEDFKYGSQVEINERRWKELARELMELKSKLNVENTSLNPKLLQQTNTVQQNIKQPTLKSSTRKTKHKIKTLLKDTKIKSGSYNLKLSSSSRSFKKSQKISMSPSNTTYLEQSTLTPITG